MGSAFGAGVKEELVIEDGLMLINRCPDQGGSGHKLLLVGGVWMQSDPRVAGRVNGP